MKSLALSLTLGAAAVAASLSVPAASHASALSHRAVEFRTDRRAAAGAYSQASAYLKQGKYAQAIAAFKTAIKNGDHVGPSYAGIGAAYLDERSYGAAFKAYQSAIKASPKTPEYLYDAAYAAVSSRAQYLATYAITYSEDYIQARRNDIKGYMVAFLAYGQLLQAKGQLGAARNIVRLAPHSADSYNYLGIALANSRSLKPAVTAFSHAIQLRSDVTQFYVNRGGVEVVLKQYGAGLRDYERARRLSHSAVEQKFIDRLIQGVHKQMKH